MPVTYTALGGLQQSEDQVDRTAALVARSPFFTGPLQDEVSLSAHAVSMLAARNSFEGNPASIDVAVLQVGNPLS